jgi:hypothetical protein
MMGDGFCKDCPDHEACATGYPCEVVKRVNPVTSAVPGDELPKGDGE